MRTSSPVARVYAAALIELGRSQNALGSVYDDLHAVLGVHDADAWFRQFFTSPRIERDVKWRGIEKAFRGKVGRPVLGLLKVLIDKGREAYFDNIVDQFDRFKDLAENRVHAWLTVAREMPADQVADLQRRLERASGRNVQVHQRVDAAVIAGAALRVGDRVLDGTLRTRLHALEKQLLAHD